MPLTLLARPSPDFVTRFHMVQEKYPLVTTDAQLIDFAVLDVSAGSDTTAIILRAVFFYLLTHPGSKESSMKARKCWHGGSKRTASGTISHGQRRTRCT